MNWKKETVMKLLEVRAGLRRATKEDLFVGDIYNVNGRQDLKDNVTVFMRKKDGSLHGPQIIFSDSWFAEVHSQMVFGMLGVLVPAPKEPKNEFLFDLVLREASFDDMAYSPRYTKLNRLYYLYADKMISGPYYVDNSLTTDHLRAMIAQNKVFIPYEKQHFKIRNH